MRFFNCQPDIEAVTALIECVQKFVGGVVLVSHDQHFVSSVGAEIWLVGEEPGKITKAESLDAYIKSKSVNVHK
jgi:ATPase subunit of ABC transporter with duplicated ATPase domains